MVTASRVLHLTWTEVSGFRSSGAFDSCVPVLGADLEADWRRINCLHSDTELAAHVAVFTNLKDRSVERVHLASSADRVQRVVVVMALNNLPKGKWGERLPSLYNLQVRYLVRDPTRK
jgi:hypothetical protein